jgi:hypothetical protein
VNGIVVVAAVTGAAALPWAAEAAYNWLVSSNSLPAKPTDGHMQHIADMAVPAYMLRCHSASSSQKPRKCKVCFGAGFYPCEACCGRGKTGGIFSDNPIQASASCLSRKRSLGQHRQHATNAAAASAYLPLDRCYRCSHTAMRACCMFWRFAITMADRMPKKTVESIGWHADGNSIAGTSVRLG